MLENFVRAKWVQKANELKSLGLYPFFRAIQNSKGNTVLLKNKKTVMIGSNNYLGLTHHPYVLEKTIQAIEKYGSGCTGSRFLNGNLEIHEQLEEDLALFLGKEKCLVFSTGMHVNLGCLQALSGPRDLILSDSENHASIIDGIRLGMGTSFKYKHGDMQELEQLLLENRPHYRHIYIVSDGVFSMTGSMMNVPKIVELAKKYDAYIYLDDAHGAGVMGHSGRGTANHYGLDDQVDLIMGTFSKSFATIGGFIAGKSELIDFLKHSARSFMFSASMPPSAVATAHASLELMQKDASIFENLWSNVEIIKNGMNRLGIHNFNSQTPIQPILVGDDIKAMQITKFLEEHGVFATPVISPAVPKEYSLIRTSYMATHTQEDLYYCLEIFEKMAKTFDIPLERSEALLSSVCP